jgi:hypothetical protein
VSCVLHVKHYASHTCAILDYHSVLDEVLSFVVYHVLILSWSFGSIFFIIVYML